DELPPRDRFRRGKVPDLTEGLWVFCKGDDVFPDVGQVREGVGHVEASEPGGPLAGEGRLKHKLRRDVVAFARGRGRTVEIRCPGDANLDLSVPVGVEK